MNTILYKLHNIIIEVYCYTCLMTEQQSFVHESDREIFVKELPLINI
jgi:hypothetical protein